MPMYQPKLPVCVAIGCSGVALVFQLVAVVGTGWISGVGGLFITCTEDTCILNSSLPDWWRACQSLSVMALGSIFSSFTLGVLHIFREDARRLTIPAVVISAVAAICVIVEVGLFADKIQDLVAGSFVTITYGYGFYLSIVAGVLSVVTAILHVVGRVTSR